MEEQSRPFAISRFVLVCGRRPAPLVLASIKFWAMCAEHGERQPECQSALDLPGLGSSWGRLGSLTFSGRISESCNTGAERLSIGN